MAKIVVADDEPTHLDLVATMLERAGHLVIPLGCGRDCLECLDKLRPDLLVSDIFMPGLDGFQLTAEIANRGLRVPVIAMTGGMRGQVQGFSDIISRLGAYAVLIKPFTADQLLRIVDQCLRQSG